MESLSALKNPYWAWRFWRTAHYLKQTWMCVVLIEWVIICIIIISFIFFYFELFYFILFCVILFYFILLTQNGMEVLLPEPTHQHQVPFLCQWTLLFMSELSEKQTERGIIIIDSASVPLNTVERHLSWFPELKPFIVYPQWNKWDALRLAVSQSGLTLTKETAAVHIVGSQSTRAPVYQLNRPAACFKKEFQQTLSQTLIAELTYPKWKTVSFRFQIWVHSINSE